MLTLVHASGSYPTIPTLCGFLEASLTAAGWSVVSGSGTTTLKMQSASTPEGLAGMRIETVALTNTLAVRPMSVDEARKGADANRMFLRPGGTKTWRIIANRYQCFVMVDASFNAAGEFAMFGTPWIPAFMGGATNSIWYGMCNNTTDANTSACSSMRIYPAHHYGDSGGSNSVTGYGGDLVQVSTNYLINSARGTPRIYGMGGSHRDGGYDSGRLQDLALTVSETYIAWRLPTAAAAAVIRGQIWNAVVVNYPLAGDTQFTYDGRLFRVVTHNIAVSNTAHPSTLCLQIPG